MGRSWVTAKRSLPPRLLECLLRISLRRSSISYSSSIPPPFRNSSLTPCLFDSADVIKTRLQTEAKKGETNYKGVIDAFKKIRELFLIDIAMYR